MLNFGVSFRKIRVVLFLGITFSPIVELSSAQAAIFASVFGLGTLSSQIDGTAQATLSNTPIVNWGGGGQLELRLGNYFGLEGGLVYLPRKMSMTDSSVPVSADRVYTYIQAPLQARFWLKNFTVGVGIYAALGFGLVTDTAQSIVLSSTYAELNTKGYDYGLIGSLGYNLPLGSWLSLMVEGRYSYGLCDINTPPSAAGTTKWRDIQAFVGFRIGSTSTR